ncbi:MAG: ATP-dependent protease LonB [Firmicutes bacterium]|nr:ATP-dependent protease LonB [Bacillota bacterium]
MKVVALNLLLILSFVQSIQMGVVAIYFIQTMRAQQGNRNAIDQLSKQQQEELRRLRANRLTPPLARKTRPTSMGEIVGQKEGLAALRAALCGPNPQHVILYGPPGVGKTAAARLVLEEAKRNVHSPFCADAPFVEVDATTVRFDERGIADPLIGSVHDPIYQGAGAMGIAGIPQPKPGAVTRANGGVLFIDEIGELHPYQLNKLLKVLEDGKVLLESAYYTPGDPNIPKYIHDIFQNGLPADFRLVGATTRSPKELPEAIRSRCVEIFFRPLTEKEITLIAQRAIEKVGVLAGPGVAETIADYANNGRDAVSMVQLAAGLAIEQGRRNIEPKEIHWVAQHSQLAKRLRPHLASNPQVGRVNGLAVAGPNIGVLLEIEAAVLPARTPGKGSITVTGIVEEEQLSGRGGEALRRKSMAKASVETATSLLRRLLRIDPSNFDIHVNFPGGMPVDGPSAGAALCVAIASALLQRPVEPWVAVTGEISLLGEIKPVGGVAAKAAAAAEAGVKLILLPAANAAEVEAQEGVAIRSVETVEEVLHAALLPQPAGEEAHHLAPSLPGALLSEQTG